MESSKFAGLHVLTDSLLRPDRSHRAIAEAALAGGASVIQFREKKMARAQMIEEAREIQSLCKAAGVPFLINDWIEVAQAIDADGVHLGQGDVDCQLARKILGPRKIIGISVDSPRQATVAEKEGADYVGVGPIFATDSKTDAGGPVGLERIAQVSLVCELPIVAIGGITLGNIAQVADAGADGAAVIAAVVCAESMHEAVRALVAKFEE